MSNQGACKSRPDLARVLSGIPHRYLSSWYWNNSALLKMAE
jgi:hypothetical protein